MAGGENTDNGGTGTYFTEDIVISILQWLPIAACIARFRCVCRSWRALLSDPKVIRKIIFSQTSDDQKVLISGSRDWTRNSSIFYSVFSYETLRPITEEPVTLMGGLLLGCCDGIFCIADTKRDRNGNYDHSITLWNPTTSEMKIVPPGPNYHPCHSTRIALCIRAQRVGFGYDPKTNDYKVVRVLEFEEGISNDDDVYDYDHSEFYHGPTPLIFTEVYSLMNDSWKTLNVDAHSAEGKCIYDGSHKTIHLRQQWVTSRNEKCYWFRCDQSKGVCAVISFDMSTEVFELITIPQPMGLTLHDEVDGVDYPHEEEVYDVSYPDDLVDFSHYEVDLPLPVHKNDWYVLSCFMLKDRVLLVTFVGMCFKCLPKCNTRREETWVLLKYGVAESWTKLYTWPQSIPRAHYLDVWKGGAYICRGSGMFVYDGETGETIHEKMEIEGTIGYFQAHVFTPTQASMSQLVLGRPERDG
ncbi:F-box protein At3g07870 [Linum grandiflorum]